MAVVLRAKWPKTLAACSSGVPSRVVTVADLPSEMLLHVFSYLATGQLLNTIPLVCRRWSELHSDPSLYRRLHFCASDPPSGDAVSLLAMAPWLKCLSLTDRHDTNAVLQQVWRSNPRLERLILRDCHGTPIRTCVSSVGLLRVLGCCKALQHLSLKGSHCLNKKLYNEIGLRLPGLKSVDFGKSACFHAEAVLNIAERCAAVEEVRAFAFRETEAWIQIHDDVLDTFSNKFSHSLKVLKVDFTKCTDASVTSLAACQNLTSLSLYNADQMTDAGAMEIGKMAALLKLGLSSADLVTTRGWTTLFKRPMTRRLLKLNLVMCEHVCDAVASVIARESRVLRELRLVGCVNISQQGHLKVLIQMPVMCEYVF